MDNQPCQWPTYLSALTDFLEEIGGVISHRVTPATWDRMAKITMRTGSGRTWLPLPSTAQEALLLLPMVQCAGLSQAEPVVKLYKRLIHLLITQGG